MGWSGVEQEGRQASEGFQEARLIPQQPDLRADDAERSQQAAHPASRQRLGKARFGQSSCPLPPPPPAEDGEGAGDNAWGEDDESGQAEEISTAQANRLRYQAYLVLSVLRKERLRDEKQLELTQAAKDVLDTSESLRTDAAVKAAYAKRRGLMNGASILRHESSLLRIGASVQADGTKEYAASTILRWVREFRTLGGFKRDARGAYERDWIMREEDVQQELVGGTYSCCRRNATQR